MYYFIINPHSKSGKAASIWNNLEIELVSSKIDYKAYFTEYAGHAIQITRQICKLQPGSKNIIIVGGDGTINEVINGLPSFQNVTIGYIPTGSGNDLARGLGISRDPFKTLSSILHPKRYAYTDIGLLSVPTNEGLLQRKFAVSAGIGYDAEICRKALVSKLKKLLNMVKLGKLTYLLIGLWQLLIHKPVDGVIIIDDVKKIKLSKIYFISFMIQKSEGGGLKMTPHAVYDDGLLSLCIVSGISRLRLFGTIPALFLGKHTNMKGIQIINSRRAEVIINDAHTVHTDGEMNGLKKRIQVSCAPEKLRFIVQK